VWCLAQWGAVWQSTMETSGVHSDRSLKYLSFFQRQCVVLSPIECYEEISSCQQRKVCLQRDYYSAGVAKSFCGRNMQSSFQQIILKFWLCLQRQSVVVGPVEYHKTKLLHQWRNVCL